MNNNKLLNISELSKYLKLIDKKTGKPSNHVLRFWESKFKDIKPIKLKGNRRYYNDKQVQKISLIKFLLKDKKLTIEGVKKILNKNINTLDELKLSSIKDEYYKNKIKTRSENILKKIKNIKLYGKKNAH